MKDKRIKERRRDFDSAQSFPFTDTAGRIICQERRRKADRRLNNIQLEVIRLQLVDSDHSDRR